MGQISSAKKQEFIDHSRLHLKKWQITRQIIVRRCLEYTEVCELFHGFSVQEEKCYDKSQDAWQATHLAVNKLEIALKPFKELSFYDERIREAERNVCEASEEINKGGELKSKVMGSMRKAKEMFKISSNAVEAARNAAEKLEASCECTAALMEKEESDVTKSEECLKRRKFEVKEASISVECADFAVDRAAKCLKEIEDDLRAKLEILQDTATHNSTTHDNREELLRKMLGGNAESLSKRTELLDTGAKVAEAGAEAAEKMAESACSHSENTQSNWVISLVGRAVSTILLFFGMKSKDADDQRLDKEQIKFIEVLECLRKTQLESQRLRESYGGPIASVDKFRDSALVLRTKCNEFLIFLEHSMMPKCALRHAYTEHPIHTAVMVFGFFS